ncbi:MAG: ATP-binding protein [Nitrospirae bacterium]|nr:ATP-binding protein [Nitrospirota bacterium]
MSVATRVALVYFLVSILYIYFSDRVLGAAIEDAKILVLVETYKGTGFVALTSLLIYSLIKKSQKENERILGELDRKVKERTAKLEEAMLLAESTNRTKSEFIANMSHELRTPLNAIIGFSEAMLSGVYGPINERHREYLGDILTSGENLLSLINDILELSKIEAGSLNLDPDDFSLKELIKSTAGIFREKVAKHGVRLEYDISDGTDVMYADQRKIKQILVNLLSNAIKFTPDGGHILITARTVAEGRSGGAAKRAAGKPGEAGGGGGAKTSVEISVRDTGIGIARDDLPRLFQAFQQLESPYQKKYSGTGLGLFLTRKLVELHGGQISVESEKDQGATFTFSLPTERSYERTNG